MKGSLGRIYGDGEIVIRQGERDGYMHVVQEGEVDVFLEKGGRELPLAVRGKGEVLGEMAIFENAPHSATVRARGDVRILTVDKRGLLRRIQEDPSLAFQMLRNLSMRVRDLSGKLARLEEQNQGGEDGHGERASGYPPVASDVGSEQPRRSQEAPGGPVLETLGPASRIRDGPRSHEALRVAVGIGVAAALLRATDALPGHAVGLDLVVGAVSAVMATEYVWRLHAARRAAAQRRGYVLSLVGLVDLAAFAPIAASTLLGIDFGTVVATQAVLWALKLARYSRAPEAARG